jgi:hypothetical protein
MLRATTEFTARRYTIRKEKVRKKGSRVTTDFEPFLAKAGEASYREAVDGRRRYPANRADKTSLFPLVKSG